MLSDELDPISLLYTSRMPGDLPAAWIVSPTGPDAPWGNIRLALPGRLTHRVLFPRECQLCDRCEPMRLVVATTGGKPEFFRSDRARRGALEWNRRPSNVGGTHCPAHPILSVPERGTACNVRHREGGKSSWEPRIMVNNRNCSQTG